MCHGWHLYMANIYLGEAQTRDAPEYLRAQIVSRRIIVLGLALSFGPQHAGSL